MIVVNFMILMSGYRKMFELEVDVDKAEMPVKGFIWYSKSTSGLIQVNPRGSHRKIP